MRVHHRRMVSREGESFSVDQVKVMVLVMRTTDSLRMELIVMVAWKLMNTILATVSTQ